MELPAATSRTQRDGRQSAAGFTMVELVIAISIAAVLMAMGVPMFRETIASNRLTSHANDMVAALNLARSQAITMNQDVSFCRATSESTSSCSTSSSSWPFWMVRTAAGTIIRRGEVPSFGGAITVKSALTSSVVTYGSDGLARTNTGALLTTNPQITVCSNYYKPNNERQITLGLGSRIFTVRATVATCP